MTILLQMDVNRKRKEALDCYSTKGKEVAFCAFLNTLNRDGNYYGSGQEWCWSDFGDGHLCFVLRRARDGR